MRRELVSIVEDKKDVGPALRFRKQRHRAHVIFFINRRALQGQYFHIPSLHREWGLNSA